MFHQVFIPDTGQEDDARPGTSHDEDPMKEEPDEATLMETDSVGATSEIDEECKSRLEMAEQGTIENLVAEVDSKVMKKLTLKRLKKHHAEKILKSRYLRNKEIKLKDDSDLVKSHSNADDFDDVRFDISHETENESNENSANIVFIKSEVDDKFSSNSYSSREDLSDSEVIQNMFYKYKKNLSSLKSEKQLETTSSEDRNSDAEHKNLLQTINDATMLEETSNLEDDIIVILVDPSSETSFEVDSTYVVNDTTFEDYDVQETVINKLQVLFHNSSKTNENKRAKIKSCRNVKKDKNYQELGKISQTGPYLCDVCGEFKLTLGTFRSHLKMHMAMKDDRKEHKCPLCPKAFNLGASLWMHTKKVHFKAQNQYVCSECGGKSFSKEHTLACEASHRLPPGAEVPRPFKCPCGKAYISKHKLLEHKSHYHRPVKCPDCSIVLPSVPDLQSHRHKVHGSIKKSKSANPPKTTRRRKKYDPAEMKVCPVCDKLLSNYYSLNFHLKHKHAVFNPTTNSLIGCNRCDANYIKFGTYIKHKNKVHSEQVTATELLSINEALPPATEPAITCRKCGQTLRSKFSLRSHKYFCTAEVPDFICGFCHLTFDGWREFREHKNTVHTLEQKLSCHICLKRFKNYRSLWTHQYVHITPQHSCPLCTSMFKRMGDLRRHAKEKHGVVMLYDPCAIQST